MPPSDLLLRLGEHDLSSEEEPYGYQERRVQIVASHPQFDPRTFEYDLALLRFYEPVTFQPNILPICVPHDDTNFVGHTAYVTGWGRLYEGKCHCKYNPFCTLCSQSDIISFCVMTPSCTPFTWIVCHCMFYTFLILYSLKYQLFLYVHSCFLANQM